MRLPGFNRKQKILRNVTLCVVLVFLLEWCVGFPVWSCQALLRRANGMYLLEDATQLLHVGEGWYGQPTVYAENNGQLLTVIYDKTPLGLRLEYTELYPPEVRYIMESSWVDEENDTYVICLKTQVVGFLDQVSRAELELTLKEYAEKTTASQVKKTAVVTLRGEKVSDYCIRFPRTVEEDFDALRTDVDAAVLRMYDESGELLESRIYTGYHSKTTSEEGEVYED